MEISWERRRNCPGFIAFAPRSTGYSELKKTPVGVLGRERLVAFWVPRGVWESWRGLADVLQDPHPAAGSRAEDSEPSAVALSAYG